MPLIQREILEEARVLASQFRGLAIIGPRQSGKTTLSKMLFGKKPYVSLENPETEARAIDNTEAFLKQYPDGAILDEAQRVPGIFRYLQEMLDSKNKRAQFILTGSNNFLIQEQVSQSLAGRIGYLQLLPLSFAELQRAGLAQNNVNRHILSGGYPEIWSQRLMPEKWMTSYIQTYVQRDVRLLRNITNLGDFTRFILVCANRAGQLVNREEISKSIGVDTKTIQAWIGVLESSYILFQLQPWYNNLNKRIIKSPKLYFYDTGLLCNLLGITTQSALQKHPLYGSIFENWIVSEVAKNRFNKGVGKGLYFFRDSAGNEVDLLVEKDGETIPLEIKSGKKLDSGMLAGLRYWKRNDSSARRILIYGGERSEELPDGSQVVSWREIGLI